MCQAKPVVKQVPFLIAAAIATEIALSSVMASQCTEDGRINEPGFVIEGGQVSLAGASLFVDFFRAPASTNDWIDADQNGFWGWNPEQWPYVQQLATPYSPGQPLESWWMFQYRSVGSVNGFNEFVNGQLCGEIPTSVPSEAGLFNGLEYANTGSITWAGPYANDSGTPYEACEIEGAFLDVPSAWAVQVPTTVGPEQINWSRRPMEPGYGLNPVASSSGVPSQLQTLSRQCEIRECRAYACSVSEDPCEKDTDCPEGEVCEDAGSGSSCVNQSDCPEGENCETIALCSVSQTPCRNDDECPEGESCEPSVGTKVSLNTRMTSPDADTLFDIVAAWVPVSIIANRGTGLQQIKYSEAQYLFTTGRMPNGENLVAATRDVGSGTRNAAMNSLGIDTSWGRGDNMGDKNDNKAIANLGPGHQASNCGGSSIMEQAVQMRRLAVGYTGLAGGSRAAADAASGKYEILDVCKDIDGDGDGNPDCNCSSAGYVRPSIDTVLDNCDPCTGYQIAGSGSFVVRGNPNANRDPGDPLYQDSQPLDNQAVADYVNNITDSIAAFSGEVHDDASLNMPGQFLATTFFLPAGIDCLHQLDNPLRYSPTTVNQVLQNFIRSNNGLGIGTDTLPYGSANVAGLVPKRNSLTGTAKLYSDGSETGGYYSWSGEKYIVVNANEDLTERNRTQGDFNRDEVRDVNDATELVAAYYTPRTWQQTPIAIGPGRENDNAIPEVLGDFNGDGNLTKEDLRYYADGLALVDGRLNRKQGHVAIDQAIAALGQPYPWADTRQQLLIPSTEPSANPTFETPESMAAFLATGKAYQAGDFRGDVAGSPVTAGAAPRGWDGVVNDLDINYVCQNIGDWSNLDQAVLMDLSCDMNGDAAVSHEDVRELVEQILGTLMGDFDLDGDRDEDDRAMAMASINGPNPCIATLTCGWSDGDSNCDGVVNQLDLAVFDERLPGDYDNNGSVDLNDYAHFGSCLTGPNSPLQGDCEIFDFDRDTDVDAADFGAFQKTLVR